MRNLERNLTSRKIIIEFQKWHILRSIFDVAAADATTNDN